MTEEHPDLVAGQLHERPRAVFHGDREPIGVGIVREDELRPFPARLGEGEIERARLLGIGKSNRGERRIGASLFGNAGDGSEPGGGEGTRRHRLTHAV
jgi:hypothetical protein